jgi:hypothetical protein
MSAKGARHAASLRGERTYQSDRPCKRGHVSYRDTRSGSCLVCKRLLDTQRRRDNPDAYNARKRRERMTKLPELAAKAVVRRIMESPDQRAIRLASAKVRSRLWRQANPKHPGILQAKQRYAVTEHGRGRKRYDTAKRRAALLSRIPKWITPDELWFIHEIYALASLRTRVTGFPWHVDHIIPLQGAIVSGLHVPSNLRVIEGHQNIAKGARYLPK